jgi:hypothetical protein
MALRLSGRLMVIQNACPRFSRITLLMSFIVPLACLLLLCKHLRQDGGALQAGFQGAVPADKTPRIRDVRPWAAKLRIPDMQALGRRSHAGAA